MGRKRLEHKRDRLILTPAYADEGEYVRRKAYLLRMSISHYVRTCAIPSNWRDELARLRLAQGVLPKLSGRPRRRRK